VPDSDRPGPPPAPGWRPPGERYRPPGHEPPADSGLPRFPGSPPGGPRRHGLGRLFHGHRDRGPLRRRLDGRLAGGVAAGLSARTGIDPTLIRICFVLASLGSGTGIAIYMLLWLFMPADGDDGNIASRALTDRRGITLAAAAVSVFVVVYLLGSALHAGWFTSFAWSLAIGVSALILVFRNAPADEQATLRRFAEPLRGLSERGHRTYIVWRSLIAGALAIAALVLLLPSRPHNVLEPIYGVAIVMVAIAVLLGPWWLRIGRDLVAERQARIRAEERADMAARVHDSVLQTLALIQRRADEPAEVIQLARAQERELRTWLFDGQAPGSVEAGCRTVAAGVRLIQQEVEAAHRVSVEAVTVGDCELDEDLSALLAAAREATVNAVKWSGAQVVSVFAEVEPAQVSVFVRDRGRGFDLEAVPGDRKGIAESVRGRMARRGGSATIRSVVGEGTEVSLTMPRPAGQRQGSRA
jgi:signal transduction histidine kinase/phage shock protein PspC (stress-responsive transcriptional regulator)